MLEMDVGDNARQTDTLR